MESIDYLRKALEDLAAQSVGLWRGLPHGTPQQMRSHSRLAEILAMPVESADYAPIQDLDPESATFGELWFMPDFDPPDSRPLRNNAGGL